jgi:hypothetical protein
LGGLLSLTYQPCDINCSWEMSEAHAVWLAALPVLENLLPTLPPTSARRSPDECTTLAELESLLERALSAVRQSRLVEAESKLAVAESRLDTGLLDSLAALSLTRPTVPEAPVANPDNAAPAPSLADDAAPAPGLAVGDSVYAKAPDRSVSKGAVTRIEADLVWVRHADDGQEAGYPPKSVKRREKAASGSKPASEPATQLAAAAAPDPPHSKVEFRLGNAPKPKPKPRPAAPEAAASPPQSAAPAPAQAPPRMPRLIVAVDTNELLPRGTGPGRTHVPTDLRAHLLQNFRSRSVDVLVARQAGRQIVSAHTTPPSRQA